MFAWFSLSPPSLQDSFSSLCPQVPPLIIIGKRNLKEEESKRGWNIRGSVRAAFGCKRRDTRHRDTPVGVQKVCFSNTCALDSAVVVRLLLFLVFFQSLRLHHLLSVFPRRDTSSGSS